MLAVFVTIQLKPGFRDEFIQASLGDARGSVTDEPGCFRFDVLQDNADPDHFHLYEVYADQDAREEHRQAPHYLRWRDTVSDWIDGDIQRTECATVFPSEDGWRSQKPHLL